ncbi:MAG: patatin-like phospholipase family protein [Anaerolineae bacterium]|nr:patatin-like phospholipase family protein [Anaerolineae bacterium]
MNYDLVFEGGGAKGMVFVGAMQAFGEKDHTYDRLLGTSAGAITAALLAAGYTTDEMKAALSEEEDGAPVFAGFMGEPPAFSAQEIEAGATRTLLRNIDIPAIPQFVEDGIDDALTRALLTASAFRNLFSLIERGGWFSAHKFVVWMQRKLNEGTFRGRGRDFADMTLGAFHDATDRDLSLVASDTSGGRMLVLNHKTAPALPLVWAVRMSMSIPMLWPEVEWRSEWGTYLGKDLTGHKIVDGGLLSNFPIELFVSTDAFIVEMMGEKRGSDVLGLLIDEGKPVPGASAQGAGDAGGLSLSQLQIAQRIGRLVNTLTGAHDKMVIEALEGKVVRLPAHGYGTTEFSMTSTRRDVLVQAGYDEMRAFLEAPAPSADAAFGPLAGAPGGLSVARHANRIASRILSW